MQPSEFSDATPRSRAPQTASPKSKPIRLNTELMILATEFADSSCRTVPTQIEFWARLGQLLERSLTVEQIHQLMTAQKQLGKVEVISPPNLNFDSVVAEVERARVDRTITQDLTQAEYVYDSAPNNLIRRTDRAGNACLGTLQNNEFVPIDDPGDQTQ